MPLSNLTPETAIEVLVSTLPYNNTQVVLEGGVIKEVYYKLRNDLTRDAVVTFWFHGDVIPHEGDVYYVPDYEGYNTVDFEKNVFDAYPNSPCEVPIKAGESYWIEVSNYWSIGVSSPNLHVSITLKPHSVVYPAGQIVIFSASTDSFFAGKGGLHTGLIDPVLGEIVNYLPFFPSTEHGDILNNGTYLINDNSYVTTEEEAFLMLDPSFKIIKTIPYEDLVYTFEPLIRTNNATNKFWIAQTGYSGTSNRYANVTSAGILSPFTDLLDFPGIASTVAAHAALNNESHLLLAPNRVSQNYIYKWNLSTLAWDGTIGTEIPSYRPTDILVMNDDTIIISYIHSSFGPPEYKKSNIIRRYNLAGTQLNTITITTTAGSTVVPRLGYAADPLYFWVWMPLTDGRSLIKKIKVSDFSVTIDTEVKNVYETSIQTVAPELIYVSDSCPIIETRVLGMGESEEGGPIPTDVSGIYFISPNKSKADWHDSYYDSANPTGEIERKIPNPIIRTAYIGD